MKKLINGISFTFFISLVMIACSGGNDTLLPEQTLSFDALACEVITIDPILGLGKSATYLWTVKNATDKMYSLSDSTQETIKFAATTAGTYQLRLAATENGISQICDVAVTVKNSSKLLSPYITKIYDFLPAVGQFTNVLPPYADGDTKETMIAKAEKYIVGTSKGSLISLGGFGGYITFGFDHTVVNVSGKRDFRILGNAFYAASNPNTNASSKGGSCEPGIVMVAYDANKNGVPDDNEWYELAGSEYGKTTTIKNYKITYYCPTTEILNPVEGSYISLKNYVYWTDNQGNSGYKEKNIYHNQSYFPMWITDDKITFKGTLLPHNAVEESGNGSYWVLYAYDYGYVDNYPNAEDGSTFDIDWAVDSNGNKVKLPGIDFVKVFTGLNQECGWLGETSTEICGAYDLHLLGEVINTKK